MNARITRAIEAITDRILLTVVVTLKRTYNMRPVPETLERFRQVVSEGLREVALASRLDVLHPERPNRGERQNLIDTVPYPKKKPRPPDQT